MTSSEPGVLPEDPIRQLLRESHLLSADQVAPTVAARAADLGFLETVIYLADYEQVSLLPLPGSGVPPRQELSIEGTVAGLAYRRMELAHTDRPGSGHHLWLSLVDGAERLGVIELRVETATAAVEDEARILASLVAELIVVNDLYSDFFSRLRRRKVMTLAAEIQWDLLPPLTFATDRVVIAGALEPAYEIGGDTFDYAVTNDTADLLVLDSVGHGLASALLSSAAVGAYRHARRSQLDLPEISQAMNTVIAQQFGASQFATAAIVRLDLDTGQLRWVNAGHPAPLILRRGSLIHLPACLPARPLGLQSGKPLECETRLQPGDQVLLYTDGIVEARSPTGEFFGEERLADFILRAAAAGDPAPETIRRLMRHVLVHQADQLQDDASIVLLEWRTGRELHLLE
ncbi:PP2C family protein-serine/threonine phosphatase [Blastococcus brunescens]|uniref:PP2C family protein-serine/threonine phosphatase n=1 Tax=Blastococcus brunescens TaxID=1564165 RepID=A0ABZ1B528_9ACTN|nr:PP2C family protein-serine/threonine phosphatase [Blastococcus sp. BMG 8361]WRL65902.1 PP2C family protein-serine/threonine phosphatase [Blastococcus sp. BMG 8361]